MKNPKQVEEMQLKKSEKTLPAPTQNFAWDALSSVCFTFAFCLLCGSLTVWVFWTGNIDSPMRYEVINLVWFAFRSLDKAFEYWVHPTVFLFVLGATIAQSVFLFFSFQTVLERGMRIQREFTQNSRE